MKKLKIAFFTESGTLRGMGHLVRCYTIFSEFHNQNHLCNFFLDSDINYDYKFKNIQYFIWDSLEINEMYDLIFIDSYEANISIYIKLEKLSKHTIYIDDYSRLNYPKGTILNFAPDAKKLFFQTKYSKYNYLLGLKYIPLRENILNIKKDSSNQIFIMLGGSDIANLSLDIIDTLKDIEIKKVIVSNNKKSLSKLKVYKNTKVLYKPNDEELLSNMANSILAISTASMTLYELSYFKIPTITIAVSKNQDIGIKQSLENKIAIFGLTINSTNWKVDLYNYVLHIADNRPAVESKIDGMGTKRVIKEIIELVK